MAVARLQSLKLLLSCCRDVSDPHDRVYGLLGLHGLQTSGHVPNEIKPDYTMYVPMVFLSAAEYVIEGHQNLKVLPWLETPDNSELVANHEVCFRGLPSWVPRWNVDSSHLTNEILGSKNRDACGIRALDHHRLTKVSKTLAAQGLYLLLWSKL